ncbi:MAG: beta-ketoacyl synthase N-terminal-like domain-containing protein, partial [Candidatus Omnitrophota bacterium]
MSAQLFKKLRKFRKQHSLSILELCQQIGAHYTTYHRWKKAQKITGPYKKIIEEFLDKHEPHRTQFQSPITSEIAVIGIACNYPGANNVKELWENILAKRVQFRRIPDKRLSLKDYYNENPKFPDKSYLTKAALIDGFDFSWSKLRIPKKTFESTDIVHWLALDTALKAFEDAGYPNSEIPFQNTGAIVGNTLTGEQTRSQTLRLRWPYVQRVLNATLTNFGVDQRESAQISMEMEKSYKSVFYPITEDSLAGGLANTIAGRICNYLNFKGGGYIVDGACSSSLLAVITAANALKLGEMDLVLAGGVDISLDPFELVGFSKAGALAKDQMRVYDQRASGFIPGEGCGFVVLKRLEDAIRDKNYIYAVIKGWGISSDGKGGIMEPSSSGQATAIHRAYKNSGYRVSDVDFIEGHGTGTTKGDKVEIEGIESAIEEFAGKDKKRLCGITSFKSIVGHTKAAAGVGGLIKAILAVNQRILPPTANCREPNEIFRERARHLYPIIKGETLTQDKAMRAGISSAGFGGINCHVTIESKEGPSDKIKPAIDERSLFVSSQETEIFVFASPSVTHLKKIIQKFKEDLRNISVAEMPDLAALLDKKAKRRAPIKIAVVTDSPEHLYDAINLIEHEIETANLEDGQIRRIKAKDSNTHIILSNNALKNRLGFLFPGQGSQRLNMTRRITERFDWAKDLLAFSRVSLRDYIYKSADLLTKEEQEEFDKKLAETQITQPAVIYSSLV